MRRLLSLTHKKTFFIAINAVYFLLRLSASAGQPAGHFPDSASYNNLAFIGDNERFWSVPLIFSTFTSDASRIFIHVLIGTIAWASLAHFLARRCRYPKFVTIATLLLGLAPQVIRYDLAILSESLGISFAVLLVTTTLWLLDSLRATARILWSCVFILFVFTRPTHLTVVVAVLGFAIISIALSRGRRPLLLAISMSCLLAWGITQLNGNKPYSTLNFYTVLIDRVVPSETRYPWFVQHGMPDVPGVRESSGYDFDGPLPAEIQNIIQLPMGQQPPSIIRAGGTPLAHWVEKKGWRTYAEYLLTHPTDTLNRLSELSAPTLSAINDDFLPLENGAMLSRSFFMPWKLWALAGLVGLALTFISPQRKRQSIYIVGMAAATALLYSATVLTAGIEHQRHTVTVAVLIRVLSLAAIVGALPARTGSKEKSTGTPDSPDAEHAR